MTARKRKSLYYNITRNFYNHHLHIQSTSPTGKKNIHKAQVYTLTKQKNKLLIQVLKIPSTRKGVIHAFLDDSLELGIAHAFKHCVSVNAFHLRRPDDASCHRHGDGPDTAEIRVEDGGGERVVPFGVGEGVGERSSGGVDHRLCDGGGMCEDGGEADGGEDVHVVALLGREGDGFVFITFAVVVN